MTTRDRTLVAIVGVIAVIALWFVLVWTPRSHAIASAHARVAAADTQAQQLRLDLARLVAAKRNAATEATTLDRLNTAVPATPDLAGLLLSMNDAASSAQVKLAGVTPAAVVAGTPTAIPVSLNVTGGYFAIVSFVQRLTALPRLVVIDGVQVTSAPNTPDLTVALTARAFTTAAAR